MPSRAREQAVLAAFSESIRYRLTNLADAGLQTPSVIEPSRIEE